jgi:hypothetical protein
LRAHQDVRLLQRGDVRADRVEMHPGDVGKLGRRRRPPGRALPSAEL